MTTKNLFIKVVTKGAKQAQASFRRLGQAVTKTSTIMSTVLAGAAVKGSYEMAKMGAVALDVEGAFKKLNRPDLLNRMREATRNTISDVELMKRSVMARNFNISLAQLPRYFEFASRRARETGQSVDYLVESIITGIGRKSVLILDNLGISALRIREEFKKTGDFAKAAGNIIEQEMKTAVIETGYAADAFDQFTTSITNLSTEWAKNVAPTAGVVLAAMTGVMNSWTAKLKEVAKETPIPGVPTDEDWNFMQKQHNRMLELEEEKARKRKEFAERYGPQPVDYADAAIPIALIPDEVERIGRNWVHVKQNAQRFFEVVERGANDLGTTYGPALVDMANQMASSLQNAIVNQWDSGTTALKNFLNMFENLAAQVAARAAIFSLFNLIPGFGAMAGGKSLTQQIFGFAQGGRPSPGQPAMVGEHGKEMFIPDRSGTIVPSHKMGSTFNLHFHGPVTNKKFVRDSILPTIRNSARLGF